MHIVADRHPMFNLDPPTPAEQRAALAANLRERARACEVAGPEHEAAIARTFSHPSLVELQREERHQADLIAEEAAHIIFGSSTRDRLTPKIASDLEQAATYVTRRIHPEFVTAAINQAADTLLKSDDTNWAFARFSAGEARMRAHWLATVMWGALIGTLECERPIALATYLRIQAAKAEREAL